jgi:hypothetical protein
MAAEGDQLAVHQHPCGSGNPATSEYKAEMSRSLRLTTRNPDEPA